MAVMASGSYKMSVTILIQDLLMSAKCFALYEIVHVVGSWPMMRSLVASVRDDSLHKKEGKPNGTLNSYKGRSKSCLTDVGFHLPRDVLGPTEGLSRPSLISVRLPGQMDFLFFIQTADPTKVRVGERQHVEGEPKLLDTTVGHVVSLLPVAPAHASSELEASANMLFDEGGSGGQTEQGDSASGGHGVDIPQVSETAEIVAEDAAPVQPKRQIKRKTIVYDAGGPSHPPKKLREDHETSTGPFVAGKSMSALQRLLAGAVLNPEVGIAALPTLPFITSSVSVTLERESEDQTDSMAEANLRTITAPPWFVISSDSSHHSGANIAEAEVDSFARPSIPLITVATTVTSIVDPATTVKEKFVESSVFGGDSSGGGADHTVVECNNGSRLDDGRTCREMVDEFAPLKFFSSIHGMDHDQLFTEFNVGAARQISLSAEVRMRAEYNIKERRRLNSVVEEKNSLLKARDAEIETLKAQLLMKEAEAVKAIHLSTKVSKFKVVEKSLRVEVNILKEQNAALEQESTVLSMKVADLATSVKVREQEVVDLDAQVAFTKSQSDNLAGRVHELETSSAGLQEKVTAYENCMGKLEEFQDEQIRAMNDKFEKLYIDFVEMALHLEKKFYPTFSLPSLAVEYLSALGAAISRAIKKGMQDGLAAEINYGQECRVACSFMLCDLDFEPLSLSLSSMPSCDLVSLTHILILCLILIASNQSLRKSLSLNLELS
ncbi:hypothetical protein Tco_0626612 [Tanacetum coccineum]|uniref:Uncharacterized protein n=1 Tax=Tanacetum coccineum TaxID=301880 RepID=A0ABQ4WK42_9ASTR